jgi:hypothetical protein
MGDESPWSTLFWVVAVVLMAWFVLSVQIPAIETDARVRAQLKSEAAAPQQGATKSRISTEQAALIAKHELAPGLTREAAIDVIGNDVGSWSDTGWVVEIDDGLGYGGMAWIDSRMTPEMVTASWGAPDATREGGLGLEYTYRQPPYGEVQVQFSRYAENVCIIVNTEPTAAYFRKHFPTWTDTQCEMVTARKIVLGMTTELARASWGQPTDINRSVGSWGVHEQWVYRPALSSGSSTYLYFENGILTSWQD